MIGIAKTKEKLLSSSNTTDIKAIGLAIVVLPTLVNAKGKKAKEVSGNNDNSSSTPLYHTIYSLL